MSKKKVYAVTAYKWGNRDNHSYFHSVFDEKAKAIKEAKEHSLLRGGKYECEVLEVDVNSLDYKIIKPLTADKVN